MQLVCQLLSGICSGAFSCHGRSIATLTSSYEDITYNSHIEEEIDRKTEKEA
jgi:hypothetical protein